MIVLDNNNNNYKEAIADINLLLLLSCYSSLCSTQPITVPLLLPQPCRRCIREAIRERIWPGKQNGFILCIFLYIRYARGHSRVLISGGGSAGREITETEEDDAPPSLPYKILPLGSHSQATSVSTTVERHERSEEATMNSREQQTTQSPFLLSATVILVNMGNKWKVIQRLLTAGRGTVTGDESRHYSSRTVNSRNDTTLNKHWNEISWIISRHISHMGREKRNEEENY